MILLSTTASSFNSILTFFNNRIKVYREEIIRRHRDIVGGGQDMGWLLNVYKEQDLVDKR